MSTGPASAETTALLLESPRRLTVEEYHRMIQAGILEEDEDVELLEGVIVSMTAQSPSHAYCIEWLTRFLIRRLGDDYSVRPKLPLTLGRWNEPEPDLAVVRRDSSSRDQHPGTALLAVEVADSSLRKDRQVKGSVYARFGVAEYWIVNVKDRVVEMFLEPDPAVGAYRRTRTCTASETITSEVLPEVFFPVAEIFG
jgi:Uma2 family endonuclease